MTDESRGYGERVGRTAPPVRDAWYDTHARGMPELETRGPFSVNVDHDMTPEQMIGQGRYDIDEVGGWPSARRLFGNQGKRGTEEVGIDLVCFGQSILNKDMAGTLERIGVRPATVPELLALGATFPDLQRGRTVCAVDSIVGGLNECIYLGCDEYGRRHVKFYWPPVAGEGTYFYPSTWIAVVRKNTKASNAQAKTVAPGRTPVVRQAPRKSPTV